MQPLDDEDALEALDDDDDAVEEDELDALEALLEEAAVPPVPS
jgi:hypothetical protein